MVILILIGSYSILTPGMYDCWKATLGSSHVKQKYIWAYSTYSVPNWISYLKENIAFKSKSVSVLLSNSKYTRLIIMSTLIWNIDIKFGVFLHQRRYYSKHKRH